MNNKYGHISKKTWKRNIKYAITLLDDCIALGLYESPLSIALDATKRRPKVYGK